MRMFKSLKFLAMCLMVTLHTKKVMCDCGGKIHAKKRCGETAYSTVVVYSTSGSQEGRHYEYRQDKVLFKTRRFEL